MIQLFILGLITSNKKVPVLGGGFWTNMNIRLPSLAVSIHQPASIRSFYRIYNGCTLNP